MATKRAPKTFEEFVGAFPAAGRAWEELGQAGRDAGPLDVKTCQLLKLAIAIGSRSEGAAHSATRKSLEAGASADELYQVVILATSTIGLPNAVAAYTWVRDEAGAPGSKRKRAH